VNWAKRRLCWEINRHFSKIFVLLLKAKYLSDHPRTCCKVVNSEFRTSKHIVPFLRLSALFDLLGSNILIRRIQKHKRLALPVEVIQLLACELEFADESANDIDARDDDNTYFFYNCSGPLSGESGPAPLSSCTALSLSRSLALPLSGAVPRSPELSLDLSSSILAFLLNKPRSYPSLIFTKWTFAYYFSVKGHFAFRVVFSPTA